MAKLRLAVVGLNMGRNHCLVFSENGKYELVAVCDINPDRILWVRENVLDCAGYADYDTMLSEVKPDAVIVATPTYLHAEMTIKAARAGAKGVYCEKPMAVDMETAEEMVSVCDKLGVALMVGHQRRVTPVYTQMKRMMEEGAIGDVYLIRATCAGDFLSDGTHSVDSVRFLMNDVQPDWLLASVFRLPIGTHLWGDNRFTGTRYGHSVDSGAQVTLQFPGRVRAEIYTGELWLPGRGYQDIEIFGTKGRIWRAGDSANPDLLIQDEKGGFREVPVVRPNAKKALDGDGHGANLNERQICADGLYHMIVDGTSHTMDGHNALKTQEIVMAVYESARLHNRITFPMTQKKFPLDLMLQDGSMV